MKTRDFKPKDGALRIPTYVLRDLQKHGHAFMPLPDGNVRRITIKDLYATKEDLDKIMAEFPPDKY